MTNEQSSPTVVRQQPQKPGPRSAGLLVLGLLALFAGGITTLLAAIASIGGPSFGGPSAVYILGVLLLIGGLGVSAAGFYFLISNVDQALAKYLRGGR